MLISSSTFQNNRTENGTPRNTPNKGCGGPIQGKLQNIRTRKEIEEDFKKMEKNNLFRDGQSQHHENVYITKSNVYIQHDSIQNAKIILHRAGKITQTFIWKHTHTT